MFTCARLDDRLDKVQYLSLVCNLLRSGFQGPNLALVTASATGLHSIGQGYRLIRDDDADVMLCGGVEAPLIPQVMAGISRIRALSFK